MRRFVIIGQKAISTEEFLLDDLPGTSGRLDILVRCLRAAMLCSHGIRRDVVVYLVLLGGGLAPRVVRVDGATASFLRPDERSLAVTIKKVLATRADGEAEGWVTVRPGFAVARGGFQRVLDDAPGARPYLLDEGGLDIREAKELASGDSLFVVGDHHGVPEDVRARLVELGAEPLSVGPVSVHADDVVALVTNEVDRQSCQARTSP